MAEAAGLAVGLVSLAGLFGSCIQCFDMVQLGRARNRDFEILHTKLDNQKVRFMIWGQAIGLDDVTNARGAWSSKTAKRLAIQSTMHTIMSIFKESGGLVNRYGLHRQAVTPGILAATGNNGSALRRTFWRFHGRLRLRNEASRASHGSIARWVITDQKKFLDLVKDLRELIDDLESFARSGEMETRQRMIVSYEIEEIPDVASLELVQEAGSDTSDALSYAASIKLGKGVESRPLTIATDSISATPLIHTARNSISNHDSLLSTAALQTAISAVYADKRSRSPSVAASIALHSQPSLLVPGSLHRNTSVVNSIRSARQTLASFAFRNKAFRLLVEQDRAEILLHGKQHLLTRSGAPHKMFEAMARAYDNLLSPSSSILNISFAPISGNILNHLCTILGPPNTPYEGGIFYVRVESVTGARYRYMTPAPKVRFLTRIYHPNIDPTGRLCMEISGEQWWPSFKLEALLLTISSFLDAPAADDPLVPEIAAEFTRNRQQYEDNARLYTKRYATGERPCSTTLEEPLDDRFTLKTFGPAPVKPTPIRLPQKPVRALDVINENIAISPGSGDGHPEVIVGNAGKNGFPSQNADKLAQSLQKAMSNRANRCETGQGIEVGPSSPALTPLGTGPAQQPSELTPPPTPKTLPPVLPEVDVSASTDLAGLLLATIPQTPPPQPLVTMDDAQNVKQTPRVKICAAKAEDFAKSEWAQKIWPEFRWWERDGDGTGQNMEV